MQKTRLEVALANLGDFKMITPQEQEKIDALQDMGLTAAPQYLPGNELKAVHTPAYDGDLDEHGSVWQKNKYSTRTL